MLKLTSCAGLCLVLTLIGIPQFVGASGRADSQVRNADPFVVDQISLYYFTDLSRLMTLLNSNVRRVTPSDALGGSKDFARARDNQTLFQADPDAGSSDPAKRVYLAAFTDSPTLFIKGRADDVAAVKDLVATFDRPQPQARIALWTLRMNVQATSKGRQRLGNAMEKVEKRLNDLRRLTTTATSLLRDEVNQEVQRAEYLFASDYANDPGHKDLFGRFRFYHEEVQAQLGFDAHAAMDHPEQFHFTKWSIPDSAKTTTLGEALMVLSLASEERRIAIVSRFSKRLAKFLAKEPDVDLPASSGIPVFPRLVRAMNLDLRVGDGWPASDPRLADLDNADRRKSLQNRTTNHPARMTPQQAQITHALRAAALQRFVEQVPTLPWLREQLGVTLDPNLSDDQIRRALRGVFPRYQSNARIAAGDQTLKGLVLAVEDDVDTCFVQPALRALLLAAKRERLDVSAMQRSEILAGNRIISRVDPGATGSLGFDRSKDRYTLADGNEFKITPVFDPSGQALRFQFECTVQAEVLDSDGTRNPKIPRVDRHSVNTVVQLSGLELRQIAGFELNTRLGKRGKPGVSQQNLIFAQTAIYPTVGDLSELLTEPVAIQPKFDR